MTKILLAATTLFFNQVVFSQKVDNAKIVEIRKTVQKINNGTGYLIKKLESDEFLEEGTDNGAELNGYFKDGKLVKIKEWIGLSSCFNTTEYYLQDGKLIFSYTKGSQSPYNDSTQTFDYDKLSMTMEYRFYFDKDKLIKSVLQGSSRCSGEPNNAMAKTVLQECERYKKLLIKK